MNSIPRYMKPVVYFFNRFMGAVRKKGFPRFFILAIQAIVAIPVTLLIILISPVFKIRLIKLYTSRIGQYGSNTYLMLCALESNDFPEEKKYIHLFYSYDDTEICNKFFHKMWSRVIHVLPFGAIWSFVDRYLISIFGKKYNSIFKKTFESSYGGHDWWGYYKSSKRQFISFTEKEKLNALKIKKALGIPEDKLFVCLLVRDDRYLQLHMPNSEDWKYHSYRNASIENYIPAIEFLMSNDIYVVRMGKEIEEPLNIKNAKLIDYASHPLKSDFMDVYLSANCHFFISTSCGIDCVPQIFYKPLVTTNSILTDMRSCMNWIFTIPKKVINTKNNCLIPYDQIYQDYQHFFHSDIYAGKDPRPLMFAEWKRKGWIYIENTKDEILSVVKEVVDLLSNHFEETDEIREMQLLFWNRFPAPRALNETNYENVKMRISPAFLKKHVELLIPQLCSEIG